jgi:hypothetical protein
MSRNAFRKYVYSIRVPAHKLSVHTDAICDTCGDSDSGSSRLTCMPILDTAVDNIAFTHYRPPNYIASAGQILEMNSEIVGVQDGRRRNASGTFKNKGMSGPTSRRKYLALRSRWGKSRVICSTPSPTVPPSVDHT